MKPTIPNRPTMTMRDVGFRTSETTIADGIESEDTHLERRSAPEEQGADVLKPCEWILSGGLRR